MRRLGINVWDAALARMRWIFDEFDSIYVSFSGGKDSGVLLELALLVARERGRKIGVFHIDYEAQYTATTEYVDRIYDALDGEVDNLRCCVPLKCPTCTSMHEMTWRPWDPDKRDLWVREMPSKRLDEAKLDFVTQEMSDYEFQEKFSSWHHQKSGAKRTCVLVGIRSEESLDRWRTIVSDRNINKYKGRVWTTAIEGDEIVNAYPIYDWGVEDIWTAVARNGWDYNRLYDLMHYAGLSPHAMRVASPFHNSAKASLKLYRALDPHVWGKMVGRVNGVNFTAMYGDTRAMGWKGIDKPEHFTWRQYAEFLLETLPDEVAENYRSKLEASKKSWRVGGGVDEKTISQLEAEGAPVRRTGRNTNRGRGDKEVVQFDDYLDDTSVDDFRRIPTYKRLCICIMKNDHVCKYMGFALTKNEMERRKSALEKYKDL